MAQDHVRWAVDVRPPGRTKVIQRSLFAHVDNATAHAHSVDALGLGYEVTVRLIRKTDRTFDLTKGD